MDALQIAAIRQSIEVMAEAREKLGWEIRELTRVCDEAAEKLEKAAQLTEAARG